MNLNPYSDNIIFFDTEFTNIDINVGELLSIGLKKLTGEELYIELDYEGQQIHPWVKKKVLPYLSGNKINKAEAVSAIESFIGKKTKKKPYLMAYVNQFDAIYWYKLFGDAKEHPAFWIPIDFASILFAHGFDPESLRKDTFFDLLGIDRSKYRQHNALDDAKLLAEVYDKFMKYINLEGK